MRHKSRRCSPPPTFGCTRTLAAKKKSSDPSHASPAAPSPCRSQAVPQGHEQKLPFSFWLRPLQLCPARFRGLSGSDLPALHSVYVQAGTWAGAWKEPQSSLGFGEPKHGPMLQRGLGPKMVKMALPRFGVFVLKWAVLSFQEC